MKKQMMIALLSTLVMGLTACESDEKKERGVAGDETVVSKIDISKYPNEAGTIYGQWEPMPVAMNEGEITGGYYINRRGEFEMQAHCKLRNGRPLLAEGKGSVVVTETTVKFNVQKAVDSDTLGNKCMVWAPTVEVDYVIEGNRLTLKAPTGEVTVLTRVGNLAFSPEAASRAAEETVNALYKKEVTEFPNVAGEIYGNWFNDEFTFAINQKNEMIISKACHGESRSAGTYPVARVTSRIELHSIYIAVLRADKRKSTVGDVTCSLEILPGPLVYSMAEDGTLTIYLDGKVQTLEKASQEDMDLIAQSL
ncbi:MAG TPA: hypothetical protein PKC28_07550 [Bdellovibrionales bacterium]|nr:hypothetical protein [Bdellovibrionales bacterium]